MLRFLPRPTVGTCRNLQHSQKSHAKTPRVQSRCGLRHETCDPGATTDPIGLTASQSRPDDFFTTTVVTGRNAPGSVRSTSGIRSQNRNEHPPRTLKRAADIASSERAADVGEITSTMVETTNRSSSTAQSSHGKSKSAKSTGRMAFRWYHETCLFDGGPRPMPTPKLTQQCQTMTTTSPLSPAVRLSLCSHEVSHRRVPGQSDSKI